ncbi:MAG: hypothetical protein IKV12_06475 [Alistipes sp.]|nr:hypothetical protein [Alistipes sp.]
MKGVQIGKWQPLGGIRLKSKAIYVVLLLLGLGNALAGVMEWHDTMAMMLFNGLCVVGLVIAVMHKILAMEPRKKWRVLSFLLSSLGVLSVFCSQFIEDKLYEWQKILLLVVGAVLLLVGGVSIVRWRRYSLAHKEELRRQRNK